MDKRLGCLTVPGIVAVLVTLSLALVALLLLGGRPFSPGALNAQFGAGALGGVHSHAETGGRCGVCHTAFWSSQKMSDRCLVCHTEVQQQLGNPATLHGAFLGRESTLACRACHTEHNGAQGLLTVVDAARFPHEATGFSLQAHLRPSSGKALACADCHGQDLLHFDVATCFSCHAQLDAAFTQAHQAAYGAGCLACHDGIDTYGKAFDHSRVAFQLLGKHTTLDCGRCHTGARSIADLRATHQDCYSCHQANDAHQAQLGTDCGQCHTPVDWTQATFDHAKAGFPLTGRHAQLSCQQCHAGGFKGTAADCAACHPEPAVHAGQFGTDCAACHTTTAWLPATFDHSKTAFPLTGKHAQVACQQCHANGFKGTSTACVSCHPEPAVHAGQFGTDCAACHTTTAWLPANFDHSKTGFPLTGKHAQVACQQCHTSGFKGTPTGCVSCHSEPAYHAGLFGTDCASCHSADGWSPAKFDRLHAFPINHGQLGVGTCRTCHPDSLRTYTCYTCHGQAEMQAKHLENGITNLTDCVSCHPTGGGGGD